MNLEYFIARRVSSSRSGVVSSKVMVRIAMISVAVSVAVMIISMGIVAGFQKEISYKVTGLSSDITVRIHAPGNKYELASETYNPELVSALRQIDGVDNVQQYINSAGIIQNSSGMQGIIVKGIGSDYDWGFLREHLVAGEIPIYTDSLRSRELVISRTQADLLEAKPGDIVNIISAGDNTRPPRFRISGIYDSGIEEFDTQLIFADINTVRRVNKWDETMVDGYEVKFNDHRKNHALEYEVTKTALKAGDYRVDPARDIHSQIYDWLNMLDMNTAIVIIIMFIVAGVNMVCGILIIVLDSTRMIGILSAQGMMRWSIQKIFVYRSIYITLAGIAAGNALGIGIALAQQHFHVIKLGQTAYMVSSVPIHIEWMNILLLNVGVFAGITLLMMLPTMIISRITPEKSIRFQ